MSSNFKHYGDKSYDSHVLNIRIQSLSDSAVDSVIFKDLCNGVSRFNCDRCDSRGCNWICETPIPQVSLTVLNTFKGFVYSFTKLTTCESWIDSEVFKFVFFSLTIIKYFECDTELILETVVMNFSCIQSLGKKNHSTKSNISSVGWKANGLEQNRKPSRGIMSVEANDDRRKPGQRPHGFNQGDWLGGQLGTGWMWDVLLPCAHSLHRVDTWSVTSQCSFCTYRWMPEILLPSVHSLHTGGCQKSYFPVFILYIQVDARNLTSQCSFSTHRVDVWCLTSQCSFSTHRMDVWCLTSQCSFSTHRVDVWCLTSQCSFSTYTQGGCGSHFSKVIPSSLLVC